MRAFSRTTGRPVDGTLERLSGKALIIPDSFRTDPSGDLVFDWDGETEVWWDEQRTETDDNGNRYFIDDYGDTVNERDLELREDHDG